MHATTRLFTHFECQWQIYIRSLLPDYTKLILMLTIINTLLRDNFKCVFLWSTELIMATQLINGTILIIKSINIHSTFTPSNFSEKLRRKLFPISNTGQSDKGIHSYCYIIISRTFLSPLQLGMVVRILHSSDKQMDFFECQNIRKFNCKELKKLLLYNNCVSGI